MIESSVKCWLTSFHPGVARLKTLDGLDLAGRPPLSVNERFLYFRINQGGTADAMLSSLRDGSIIIFWGGNLL